ncbi:MAG TPA: phosphotransacetylase family protein [Anaerolineae bacterium]
MVASLYVTSAETFSGKSAVCVGMGMRFRQDGFKAGYMKPVNVDCPLCDGLGNDDDVLFAKQILEMPESPDLIGPVALTPAKLEQQMRGASVDWEARLKNAYDKVAANRDVLVLEGGRSMREGYVTGLPPRRVVELLDSQTLLVLKHDLPLMLDRALSAKNYFGDRLLGTVINQVPRNQVDWVHDLVVPFLKRQGVEVFGVLPKDQVLAAPSVRELAEGLGAEILCCSEAVDNLVETMLVGAMSVESALSYFRRQPNKAVITGGDRGDIQLAALETSTRCLILTGNLYPSPAVLNRAEEMHCPIILTNKDTLTTTEIIEGYFGRSRFQQPQKINRFAALLNENFNFDALYTALKLKK